MFKSGLLTAVAALATVLGAAGAGHAGVVNWTISDGKFADGGSLSGTFSIDTGSGQITAYDLVTTPGSPGSFPSGLSIPGPTQFGTEYSPTNAGAWGAFTGLGYPSFAELAYTDPNYNYLFTWQLDLTGFPTNGKGDYSLAGGTEGLFLDAEIPSPVSRTLVSGEAVGVAAVPEPATWAMMILGVAMMGSVARRRRREMAVAA